MNLAGLLIHQSKSFERHVLAMRYGDGPARRQALCELEKANRDVQITLARCMGMNFGDSAFYR
jgi:hypothetical protein